jgi:hypothetical protein
VEQQCRGQSSRAVACTASERFFSSKRRVIRMRAAFTPTNRKGKNGSTEETACITGK